MFFSISPQVSSFCRCQYATLGLLRFTARVTSRGPTALPSYHEGVHIECLAFKNLSVCVR